MTERHTIRLGVLISGTGRTLVNLADRIADGSLLAKIVVVVSSKPGVIGLDRARRLGLPTEVVNRNALSDAAFHESMTRALESAAVDLVCMAGFLAFWRIPTGFEGRVINIHPALLPAFGGQGYYGDHVHRAVLQAGCSQSGCTVHFCDNEYDHGPIILQRTVPVLPNDTQETLADRVFEQECIAYPEAIRRIANGLTFDSVSGGPPADPAGARRR